VSEVPLYVPVYVLGVRYKFVNFGAEKSPIGEPKSPGIECEVTHATAFRLTPNCSPKYYLGRQVGEPGLFSSPKLTVRSKVDGIAQTV